MRVFLAQTGILAAYPEKFSSWDHPDDDCGMICKQPEPGILSLKMLPWIPLRPKEEGDKNGWHEGGWGLKKIGENSKYEHRSLRKFFMLCQGVAPPHVTEPNHLGNYMEIRSCKVWKISWGFHDSSEFFAVTTPTICAALFILNRNTWISNSIVSIRHVSG